MAEPTRWHAQLVLSGVVDANDISDLASLLATPLMGSITWMNQALMADPTPIFMSKLRSPGLPAAVAKICDAFCLSYQWHARPMASDAPGEIWISDREAGLTGHFPLDAEGNLASGAVIPPEWQDAIARWQDNDALPGLTRVQSAHALLALTTRPDTRVSAQACITRRAMRAAERTQP